MFLYLGPLVLKEARHRQDTAAETFRFGLALYVFKTSTCLPSFDGYLLEFYPRLF